MSFERSLFILKMNSYNLKARVYPVILTIVPIIIIGIAYSLHLKSYYQLLSSFGVTTASYFLLSQLGRDKGKAIEKEMWKKWNGAPTTQILRYSDDSIDKHTKIKYHQKLKELTNIGNEINEEFEKISPKEADEIYQSWSKYLISKTRDSKKYNLLFQENINYGFRRNLFGLKSTSISIIIFLLIGSAIYSLIINGFKVILISDLIVSKIILMLILFFWIKVVKEKWIKTVAFSYAERLIETINIMEE